MNLTELALKHGSDKAGHHNYTPIYEHYLGYLRDQAVTLMELGIGGYHYPDRGGGSLKMWHDYFLKGKIIGIDLYEKKGMANARTVVLKGSQDDEGFLKWVVQEYGIPDIIVDDASHISPLTIRTFGILFPLLKPGGIYIVEDVHTSYWHEHGYEGNPNPREGNTTMNFFKQLCDQVNYETLLPGFKSPIADTIASIHFHKNLVIINKQPNG